MGFRYLSGFVQPLGKFISHSTNSGFIEPPAAPASLERAFTFSQSTFGPQSLWYLALGVGHITRPASLTCWPCLSALITASALICRWSFSVGVGHQARHPGCFAIEGDNWFAFAVGVAKFCDDEDPVPPVRGADGGSGNTVPLRIIPALGQRPENGIQSPSKESWYVFQDDVARSYQANDPHEFVEKPGALSFEAGSLSGVAEILAGESSADDVDMGNVLHGGDVFVAGNPGPVLGQDTPSIGVFFALPNHRPKPCPFQA